MKSKKTVVIAISLIVEVCSGIACRKKVCNVVPGNCSISSRMFCRRTTPWSFGSKTSPVLVQVLEAAQFFSQPFYLK